MKYILHDWYIIQTFVNKEKKLKIEIDKRKIDKLITLLPLRKLCIKRKGEFHWEWKPLFSGYLFINKKLSKEDIREILKINCAIKILSHTQHPLMVPEKDMRLIFQMMDQENQIGESKGFFLNDRVKIVAGPLKNLEGYITHVDKHRKHITVRLPFFNTFKNIQLSFELIEHLENPYL